MALSPSQDPEAPLLRLNPRVQSHHPLLQPGRPMSHQRQSQGRPESDTEATPVRGRGIVAETGRGESTALHVTGGHNDVH